MRSKAVAERRLQCAETEFQNERFAGSLASTLTKPDSIVGNHALRVARRDATDAALKALDLRGRCRLVYDEEYCLTFVRKHERVILREAVHAFNRSASAARSRGPRVRVRDRREKYVSKIEVATRPEKSLGVLPEERAAEKELNNVGLRGVLLPGRADAPQSSTASISVSGVDAKSAAAAFETHSPPRGSSPAVHPERRKDLDLASSEGAHVFLTLRRHDPTKPVAYANGTFWQRTGPGGSWTDIVGWEASSNKSLAAEFVKLDADTAAFVLPASFRQLAVALLGRFRKTLVKSTLPRSRSGVVAIAASPPCRSERLIRPSRDTPLALRGLYEEFDRCLDVLLAAYRDCKISVSTLAVYRRKFRRYLLFSFSLYLLNRDLHQDRVTPLPFNFFNAFAYMYCHEPGMRSGSYLNTLCFLNNYVFKPCGDAGGPAASMKRLVDRDYAFLRGGKAATREFGSPAKTSVHTRTVVSFLAFAEMAVGALCHLLSLPSGREEGKAGQRVRSTLERLCDGIVFVFFTFVFFHRFGGVKGLDARSALRLALGQPHFHTSKAKAARLVKTGAADAKSEYDLSGKSASTRLSGMSVSHPHLLGLPFGVQARLGVPVGELHPLVAAGKAAVASTRTGTDPATFPPGTRYALGFDLAAPPPPAPDCAAGELGMFENVVSDVLDGCYGAGFTLELARATENAMDARDPYSPPPPPEPPGGGGGGGGDDNDDDDDSDAAAAAADLVVLDCSLCPGGSAPVGAAADLPAPTQTRFELCGDLADYWRASPMRLVFVLVSDKNGKGKRNRYLSMGDMALLALWVKRRVLGRAWTSPAINPSNYNWLATVLCRHLLLADLANFGIWGDVKCEQKLDCTTGKMHKNGVRLPTERERRRFAKFTSLDDRKSLAVVHANVNVRTRTHVGRVSSASWAVDAIRTVSAGDSAVFTCLASDLDTYHLAHTNAANFFPYYSSNCSSNEGENGLWGYVRRTSEKLAKAELQKGRFAGLPTAGVANTAVAATAMAASAEVDLGEREAVVDEASRRAVAKRCMVSHAASRGRLAKRRSVIDGVLSAARGETPAKRPQPRRPFPLKEIWGWPTRDRRDLVRGRRVRVLCRHTAFLAAAVPDRTILYGFDGGSSSLKLGVRLSTDDAVGRAVVDGGAATMTIRQAKRKLEDRVVITADATVAKYCKLGLATDGAARRDMEEHDLKQRLASGILKVCSRQDENDDARLRERLASSLAYVARQDEREAASAARPDASA